MIRALLLGLAWALQIKIKDYILFKFCNALKEKVLQLTRPQFLVEGVELRLTRQMMREVSPDNLNRMD